MAVTQQRLHPRLTNVSPGTHDRYRFPDHPSPLVSPLIYSATLNNSIVSPSDILSQKIDFAVLSEVRSEVSDHEM